MTENQKNHVRGELAHCFSGPKHVADYLYGGNGESQERADGALKVFGYWVGNQDAKQFVKTGVGSTWAEALEQALTFAEGEK